MILNFANTKVRGDVKHRHLQKIGPNFNDNLGTLEKNVSKITIQRFLTCNLVDK